MYSLMRLFALCFFTAGVVGLALVIRKLRLLRRNSSHEKPKAPGPRKLPVVGNMHQLLEARDWEMYTEWSRTYNSDILHVSFLGLDALILNSYKSAVDLLEDRPTIYSGRTSLPLPLIHTMTGLGHFFSLVPYGKQWPGLRQMLTKPPHDTTTRGASMVAMSKRAESTEKKYSRRLLLRLLDSPQDFTRHIQEFTVAAGLSSIYGVSTPSLTGLVSSSLNKVLSNTSEAFLSSGALFSASLPFVNPILDLFPALSPKKALQEFKRNVEAVQSTAFQAAFLAWELESSATSPLSNSINSILSDSRTRPNPFTKADVGDLIETTHVAFSAFNLTISPTLVNFILAMNLHPHVQATAQKESDRVLKGRFPTVKDLNSLPYVSALYKEVLRWRPLFPWSAPFAVTQDDMYRDFFISKNTVVLANQWAMCRDEEYYPDAKSFKPERFLKPNGQLNPDVLDPAKIVFGHGKRACPGRDMAASTIQFAMATILTAFDIQKALDENGQAIEPTVEYSEEAYFTPPTFPCRIVPRSERVTKAIREMKP